MKVAIVALVCALLVATASAAVYLEDDFSEAGWEDRWVQSTHKSDYGKFELTSGKWYDDEDNKGIQTSRDARFYALSQTFEAFNNKGKDLVIQFSVKFEQDIDCGGGYVKVFGNDVDASDFHGESPYFIMFGPDICGPGTRKVHAIFNYEGENVQIKKDVRCETDTRSHLYTLIVRPDNTYEIRIDGVKKESGSLEEDWDMLPPREIKDPNASKPEDWEDEAEIADPSAEKPEGWDDIPALIADETAEKPDDWDDEIDGDWEPPMIDNPAYRGEWEAPQIPNPNYKGPWVHPVIPNPDFAEDDELYAYEGIAGVAIDIWQVKSGTIFDNFLITDDVDYAETKIAEFEAIQKAEKTMFDEVEEERRAAEEEERKQRDAERAEKEEAERKRREEEEGEESDEDLWEDEDYESDFEDEGREDL